MLDHASNAYPRTIPGAIGMFPFGAVIRDLDGDGRADLAFVNYVDNTVSILTKNAGAGYTAAAGGSTDTYPTGIVAGDLNGDGRTDLVTSNSGSGDVTVLLRTANAGYRVTNYATGQYWDPAGKEPDQWEMYDLKADPLERVNLAHEGHKRTPAQTRQFRRLRAKLARVERTRLQPLS